jgi:hypothetical protein
MVKTVANGDQERIPTQCEQVHGHVELTNRLEIYYST